MCVSLSVPMSERSAQRAAGISSQEATRDILGPKDTVSSRQSQARAQISTSNMEPFAPKFQLNRTPPTGQNAAENQQQELAPRSPNFAENGSKGKRFRHNLISMG